MARRPLSRRALLRGGSALAALCALSGRATVARAQAERRPLPRAERRPEAAARSASGPVHGWNPEVAGPETADLHVAPSGDDGAPGTRERPLRTIQAGVDRLAALGRGSLAVHAGTYRETVRLHGLRGRADAPFRIHRFGRGRVTISAAEPMDGWEPLPAVRAARLGLPKGRIWRAPLPEGTGGGDGLDLSLREAGIWCPLATWRADPSDADRTGDPRTFWEAAGTRTDAAGHVLGVEDPRLAALGAALEPDALARARLVIWHSPNVVTRTALAGIGEGGRLLVPAQKNLRAQMRQDVPVTRYALENVAAGMAPGHWMLDPDSGKGTEGRAVLFWPRDPAHLAGLVERSARETCIDIGGANHVELLGLEAVDASGDGLYAGSCIRRIKDGTASRGIRIVQCRAAGAHSSDRRGYGGIALADCEDLALERITVEGGRNAFGLFLLDCRDANLRRLHISDVSNSAARFFGLRRSVLAFSLFERGGWDAHANQFNFYEGCDEILVYGVRTQDLGGYVTFQEASRIFFAFCDLGSDPDSSGRALVSQNRLPGAGQGGADGSGDPVAGGTFVYWNNTLRPPGRGDKANALMLGPGASSQRHAVFNNVIHGGGVADIYTKDADPSLEARGYNLYTGRAYWQQERYGWRFAHGEAEGGPAILRLLSGRDMRDVIAALAPRFPSFSDWDRDVDGKRIHWDAPPVGCRA